MLPTGIILVAVSYLVGNIGRLMIEHSRSIVPYVPPKSLLAVYAVAYVLRALGCVLGAVACSILFMDRQLPLKPLERLAAMLGLLVFMWLLVLTPTLYWPLYWG